MDAARPVTVTGTVWHLGTQVVVTPTRPPAPTRPPESEHLRKMFLAANPGWTPTEADVGGAARRNHLGEELRSGSATVVELHGTDLPADSVRAKLHGVLRERSVHVDSWQPEPDSTSAWADPRVGGTDLDVADAIIDTVPDDDSLISIGVTSTTAGRSAVMLEVAHLTPELAAWLAGQPLESVQLDVFVDFLPGLHLAAARST
ncbi:MAG TPA: hypothetical protein VGC37_11325 [Friedmanniella sp.]